MHADAGGRMRYKQHLDALAAGWSRGESYHARGGASGRLGGPRRGAAGPWLRRSAALEGTASPPLAGNGAGCCAMAGCGLPAGCGGPCSGAASCSCMPVSSAESAQPRVLVPDATSGTPCSNGCLSLRLGGPCSDAASWRWLMPASVGAILRRCCSAGSCLHPRGWHERAQQPGRLSKVLTRTSAVLVQSAGGGQHPKPTHARVTCGRAELPLHPGSGHSSR